MGAEECVTAGGAGQARRGAPPNSMKDVHDVHPRDAHDVHRVHPIDAHDVHVREVPPEFRLPRGVG